MNQRVNEYNQPIGREILNWKARKYPTNINYEGMYSIVTRLTSEHLQDLFNALRNTHPSNWTYLFDEPTQDFSTFKDNYMKKINSSDHVYYAVIDKRTNKVLGSFSLMRIDQANGVIEVGKINFSDAMKGTRLSTEAHYLLASYVFDELNYRRYEWKCDSLNAASIKAAKRLGFTYEGTFRNAVIYKNRSRDTAWFSMLKEEWASNKKAFEKWLAKENFDENGIQYKKLEDFRQ